MNNINPVILNEDGVVTIETIATFSDIEPSDNPSFHRAKARIMAIESLANRCNFSRQSVIHALPTLKNVPIVTYYNEHGNLGDHEMSKDKDGKPIFKTYGIGTIPESAEQWIEEVEENGQTKQYLCSDLLLWKRQKHEYEFIQKHKELSVSMEVQITNSQFNKQKVLEVDSFYFTAVTVLGIGVQPAFNSACLTFSKQDEDYQQMLSELNNYDGAGKMNFNENENGQPLDPQQTQEPVDPQEPTVTPENQEPDGQESTNCAPAVTAEPTSEDLVKSLQEEVTSLKAQLEAEASDNGRVIADLNKEKNDLQAMIDSIKDEMTSKVAGLEEQLKGLQEYKDAVEANIRDNAIQQIKSDFFELASNEEYQAILKQLEKGDLTPKQAEDQCYSIVGKLEKAKRKTKPQSNPKLNINATHKEPQQKDSRYGSLLYR